MGWKPLSDDEIEPIAVADIKPDKSLKCSLGLHKWSVVTHFFRSETWLNPLVRCLRCERCFEFIGEMHFVVGPFKWKIKVP